MKGRGKTGIWRGWKERKKHERQIPILKQTKKATSDLWNNQQRENIIENFLVFVLATAARNNKLPFSCSSLGKHLREKQSEGKFNQVIKHFLLKHQLNLMVFLLPSLLNVDESPGSRSSKQKQLRKLRESNCNIYLSISLPLSSLFRPLDLRINERKTKSCNLDESNFPEKHEYRILILTGKFSSPSVHNLAILLDT